MSGSLARLMRSVVVVIPANDEEELLGECLESVVHAADTARLGGLDTRIIVVLDACGDGSAAIARGRPEVEVIEVDYRSVGAARAHGVAHALSAAKTPLAELWIANTDADSSVPPDWIIRQLDLADDGVQVVIGAIRPDPDDLTTAQYAAWMARHRATAGARHIHGANLGVRADVYLAAGGFSEIPLGEDVALVEALQDWGAKTVWGGASPVQTSARTVGRTPGGFAEYVREFY